MMMPGDDTHKMTELSANQSKHLRNLARSLDAAGAIGKAGLTEAAVKAINRLLDEHELVKVRLKRALQTDREEAAGQLVRATGASLVAVTGRTVVLYRANDALPTARRVVF